MKSSNSRHNHRKPDLLTLLTSFVGVGVLVTGLVQADGTSHRDGQGTAMSRYLGQQGGSTFLNWQPSAGLLDARLNVARPFGNSGPSLTLSASAPRETRDSLRASGNPEMARKMNRSRAYLSIMKRW